MPPNIVTMSAVRRSAWPWPAAKKELDAATFEKREGGTVKKGREMMTCKVGSDKDDAGVEDRDAAGDAAFVACGVHDAAGHSCGAPDLAERQHGLAGDDEEDDADELLRADAGVHVAPHGL